METVTVPYHVVEALKQVASESGFKEPEFHYDGGSDKGFVGLIKRCRIKESDKCLSVMCKLLPNDEDHNKKYDSFELFRREVLVYQKFLPELKKIQLEHGLSYRDLEGFWSYPKSYYSEFNEESPEKSLILMEDLTVDDFITKDMFKPADLQHAKRIFIELGKLHAISFALKTKKPKVFEQFKGLKDLMCRLMTTESMKDLAPRNIQLASDLFVGEEEQEIKEKVLSLKDDLWQQVAVNLDGQTVDAFGVVCHGDCWINNVMFNYSDESSETIKAARLVDWQMTRFGSAASELMYFMFCYTDKALRDQHQKELMETYYDTVRMLLRKFNLNIDMVFPIEQFEKELKTFGMFAFAMTSFAMPIVCRYPEKLFKDKQAELTEDEESRLARYNQTMRDIICDMIKMGAL